MVEMNRRREVGEGLVDLGRGEGLRIGHRVVSVSGGPAASGSSMPRPARRSNAACLTASTRLNLR